MIARFSKHSIERIQERVKMSPGEIAQILNTSSTVDIGDVNNSVRLKRLFYSKIDRCCFIAIQNMKNGFVITVVPAGRGKHTSLELRKKARQLIEVLDERRNTANTVINKGHKTPLTVASYTEHSIRKILERTKSSLFDISQILNTNCTVNIKYTAKSKQLERLFYSKIDKVCFLAIQDIEDGTVLTIVRASHNDNQREYISLEVLEKAKSLIEGPITTKHLTTSSLPQKPKNKTIIVPKTTSKRKSKRRYLKDLVQRINELNAEKLVRSDTERTKVNRIRFIANLQFKKAPARLSYFKVYYNNLRRSDMSGILTDPGFIDDFTRALIKDAITRSYYYSNIVKLFYRFGSDTEEVCLPSEAAQTLKDATVKKLQRIKKAL